MSSCLGLFIENNIIKYAKISKEHDIVKVESFGVKFYDNLEDTVKQIVSETFSFKTPISINLTDEKYTYSNLFSLLRKKDLDKAINTEFEYFCTENGKNRKALEYREILTENLQDKDKIGVMYAYTEKADIIGKVQALDGYRISNIVPLPIAIKSLNNFDSQKNSIIVNIESQTSVTTIVNGKIYRIDTIENGMKKILDEISKKENSYAKAYEICKNTTIYTTEGKNLQIEENEYLQDIMPNLYDIVEKVRAIISKNGIEIEDIYITGLASVINNIDLYFQENFLDKKCEILVPFFAQKSNLKINIKDYIEVNSAIALALEGLGLGTKEANFKYNGKLEKISQLLTGENNGKTKQEATKKTANTNKLKEIFKIDFGEKLDSTEMWLIRTAVSLLILLVVYIGFTKFLMSQINNKNEEMQAFIKDSETKIAEVQNYNQLLKTRMDNYNSLIEQIDEQNEKISQISAKKNAIPNLLNKIMFSIPKEVQLVSITNISGKTIQIEAQAKKYEQLGYFIASIKNEGILLDVTSTSGNKNDELIKVTIKGNLNY